MTRLIALGLLAFSIGCAHKPAVKLPDLEIPPACAKQILLKQCNTKLNPPKCKIVIVDYEPASCAIVHLR